MWIKAVQEIFNKISAHLSWSIFTLDITNNLLHLLIFYFAISHKTFVGLILSKLTREWKAEVTNDNICGTINSLKMISVNLI